MPTVVLSDRPEIRTIVAETPDLATGDHTVLVVGREHPECVAALKRRGTATVVLVMQELNEDPPFGADLVVSLDGLHEGLQQINRQRVQARSDARDRLLQVSLLSGLLDDALRVAATEIAAGFGVERCVISLRGDSRGAAEASEHTWDSLAWAQTADRFRVAAASGATVLAPTSAGTFESYLAVPLDAPAGSQGFLGLVAERPLLFARDDNAALRAISSRLGNELGWRAIHQRTSDDLDRLANGPGIDRLLGIWNPNAMVELAATQLSAAGRLNLPLRSEE